MDVDVDPQASHHKEMSPAILGCHHPFSSWSLSFEGPGKRSEPLEKSSPAHLGVVFSPVIPL